MAAGPIFAEKLGEDYYSLALGAYDKMILMVYYLEAIYEARIGLPTASSTTPPREIAKGLEFIQTLEDNHVIPSAETLTGDGAGLQPGQEPQVDGRQVRRHLRVGIPPRASLKSR